MGARKWVVVLTVFALLTGQTSAEFKRPAGLVLAAGKARVDQTEALRGATIFAGQHLSTAPGGTLRVQFGDVQLALAGASAVWLEGEPGALRVELRMGTASVAWKGAASLELLAGDVNLRPDGSQPVHAAVTVVSPRELVVACYSGSLAARFAGTTHIIPAGAMHKATLPQGPPSAGKSRGVAPIVWVAIGAAAAITGIGLWLSLREDKRPVSPSVP